jgi:quercetin dioxygenase-like cupin family protein
MRPIMLALFAIPFLLCQPASNTAVLSNLATAKWVHDKGDPPGSTNVLLREDAKTGAMELLVRYPAGHVFRPHWHSANERIILLEGRLSLAQPDGEKFLDPGGYAYLPAKEVQRLSCVSKTPCTWYIYWDAKLDFHPAQ